MREDYTIILVRHGRTPGNIRRGYIGCRTDEDLAEAGRQELRRYSEAGRYPQADFLFLSPMKRCRQTAEIIWPGLIDKQRYEIIENLRECDFGDFDGKSYSELNGVPDFQHWVDSNGMDPFPNGESPKDFQDRSAEAFLRALDLFFRETADDVPEAASEASETADDVPEAASEASETAAVPSAADSLSRAAFAVHGGTIMSVMQRFAPEEDKDRGYYDWHVFNGDGFVCTINRREWERTHRFTSIRKILPEEERKG